MADTKAPLHASYAETVPRVPGADRGTSQAGSTWPGYDYDSSRRRHPVINELLALFRYRHLTRQLISRNIKTRYKRSVLGVAWTMLSPLLMMTVLTIVFSNLFKSGLEHYTVFLITGFTLWAFFAQTSAGIMTELTWGGSLISKIYVPPSVFAISAIGSGFVNFLLALIPLMLIVVVMQLPLTWSLLFLPVPILFTSMFTLGVGLVLSRLAIYFRDVVEMYQILIMVWFYASPIIYPIEAVGEDKQILLLINPMYYLIEIFRAPIYQGRLPDPELVLVSGAVSVTTLVVGWWYFTQKVDEFAYRV